MDGSAAAIAAAATLSAQHRKAARRADVYERAEAVGLLARDKSADHQWMSTPSLEERRAAETLLASVDARAQRSHDGSLGRAGT